MVAEPEQLADGITLYEGDCLECIAELDQDSIDAVLTDPPYCSGAATEAGRGAATHQGLRSETMRSGRFDWFDADNMTTSGLVWLLRTMAVRADRPLKKGGSILAFCDWRMAFSVGPAMESAGYRLRNLIFWDKESFGCGYGFRPQHEVILHLTRRSPEFHAADVGNVIRHKAKRVPSGDRSHPTEKPIDLMGQLMSVASPVGGTVLDPFAGSGATGVAALLEGRRCILIEKDPAYCDVIRRRIRDASGTGPGSLFAAATVPTLFDAEGGAE